MNVWYTVVYAVSVPFFVCFLFLIRPVRYEQPVVLRGNRRTAGIVTTYITDPQIVH